MRLVKYISRTLWLVYIALRTNCSVSVLTRAVRSTITASEHTAERRTASDSLKHSWPWAAGFRAKLQITSFIPLIWLDDRNSMLSTATDARDQSLTGGNASTDDGFRRLSLCFCLNVSTSSYTPQISSNWASSRGKFHSQKTSKCEPVPSVMQADIKDEHAVFMLQQKHIYWFVSNPVIKWK